MAQYRQSGTVNGARNGDHVSIGIRGSSRHIHHRRSKSLSSPKISIGFCVLTLSLILSLSALCYFILQSKGGGTNGPQVPDDDPSNETDFLMDVTQIQNTHELKFGNGSVERGRDSRYWDKDDRRRDEDYSEEELERGRDGSADNIHKTVSNRDKQSSSNKSHKPVDHRGNGLYNEAGRNELKMYEAEYEASLKSTRDSTRNQQSEDGDERKHRNEDATDEYDDGIDLHDDKMEEDDDKMEIGLDDKDNSSTTEPHNVDIGESSNEQHGGSNKARIIEEDDKASNDYTEEALPNFKHVGADADSELDSSTESHDVQKLVSQKKSSSKKKKKIRGACEMKTVNSTSLLVEPIESRKFARFSLQYTQTEEKPMEEEQWEPKFAGHQSLSEREESFVARDQKINCGFVKGPEGSPSTGFDMAEDDAKYISSCHIAVISAIFGNSDRLRSPGGRTVSRQSRKNVCFVMFVDELTMQTLSSEGHMPDPSGFIGFWKIVVVKNLPYTDMRRVGKIPKLLPHRLFPSARYSIWLDSKLRLQFDPLLLLEYFLWRKGYEYAISNHYDRHCLWEEVAQNKRLNKYDHAVIDYQFEFYQADGMKRFNASDPNKLLPSNVPEGSFIVRAHTPMSNLFSCLWYNEVERFTPRDQLSFAYTYHKLRKTNPEKSFHLNMFKDCERRKVAKLFRHRAEETRVIQQKETE